MHIGNDGVEILLDSGRRRNPVATLLDRDCISGLAGLARHDELPNALNLLAPECDACHHHLQAVVLRWIVAARNSYTAAAAGAHRAEVDHRCWHLADINDINAAGH